MSTKNIEAQLAATATEDQVEHICDNLTAEVVRRLSRDRAQWIITNGGVFLTAFNAMVEAFVLRMSNWIIRQVKVNRDRSPNEVISATNCRPYVNDEIVRTMPRRNGSVVEMVYFKPDSSCYDENGLISETKVAAEYESRGVEPDPYSQAADNEAHPEFANEHPNGCQWSLEGGGYGFLAFREWPDWRGVSCGRDRGG